VPAPGHARRTAGGHFLRTRSPSTVPYTRVGLRGGDLRFALAVPADSGVNSLRHPGKNWPNSAMFFRHRRSLSVIPVDGQLYVTTYPCHLCYKHALSVQVASVHYIEPYPKSRASVMYPSGSSDRLASVRGVAPPSLRSAFRGASAVRVGPLWHIPGSGSECRGAATVARAQR